MQRTFIVHFYSCFWVSHNFMCTALYAVKSDECTSHLKINQLVNGSWKQDQIIAFWCSVSGMFFSVKQFPNWSMCLSIAFSCWSFSRNMMLAVFTLMLSFDLLPLSKIWSPPKVWKSYLKVCQFMCIWFSCLKNVEEATSGKYCYFWEMQLVFHKW